MLSMIDRLAGWWIDYRTRKLFESTPIEERAEITRAELTQTGYNIAAIAPGLMGLADQCSTLLEAYNCKNYLEVDMWPRIDRNLPPIRVTVQWAGKDSPAQKASRLEKEVDRLRAELTVAKEQRDIWMEEGQRGMDFGE